MNQLLLDALAMFIIIAMWVTAVLIIGGLAILAGRILRLRTPAADDLMAVADATKEMPAGPCGCKWFDPLSGEPVYQPCKQHDYSHVAVDFETWEAEWNRQNPEASRG